MYLRLPLSAYVLPLLSRDSLLSLEYRLDLYLWLLLDLDLELLLGGDCLLICSVSLLGSWFLSSASSTLSFLPKYLWPSIQRDFLVAFSDSKETKANPLIDPSLLLRSKGSLISTIDPNFSKSCLRSCSLVLRGSPLTMMVFLELAPRSFATSYLSRFAIRSKLLIEFSSFWSWDSWSR